jgi:hypothetical protein
MHLFPLPCLVLHIISYRVNPKAAIFDSAIVLTDEVTCVAALLGALSLFACLRREIIIVLPEAL